MGVFNSALSAVFEIYLADMFYGYFGEKRLQKKYHIPVCVIFTLLLTVTTYFFIPTNHSMYSYSILIILFSFLFKIKPIMRIFSAVSHMFIIMFGETVMTLFIFTFTDIDMKLMRDHTKLHWLIAMILSKLIAFGLFKIIGLRRLNTQGLSAGFLLGLFSMPLSSMFIIFLMFDTISMIEDEFYLILVILSGTLLTLANIFVFYIIEKQGDYIKTKQQLEFAKTHIDNQKLHYKELYEQQETIKKFRHDSKNMYAALLTKIETMSPGEAAAYVREQLDIVNSFTNEVNSGNPVIDAVVRSKMLTAESNNIKIRTSFKLAAEILINDLELGVLIGNALDNAIEASAKLTDDTKKIIDFSVVSVEEMLSIKVENNCPPPAQKCQILGKG